MSPLTEDSQAAGIHLCEQTFIFSRTAPHKPPKRLLGVVPANVYGCLCNAFDALNCPAARGGPCKKRWLGLRAVLRGVLDLPYTREAQLNVRENCDNTHH